MKDQLIREYWMMARAFYPKWTNRKRYEWVQQKLTAPKDPKVPIGCKSDLDPRHYRFVRVSGLPYGTRFEVKA